MMLSVSRKESSRLREKIELSRDTKLHRSRAQPHPTPATLRSVLFPESGQVLLSWDQHQAEQQSLERVITEPAAARPSGLLCAEEGEINKWRRGWVLNQNHKAKIKSARRKPRTGTILLVCLCPGYLRALQECVSFPKPLSESCFFS